MVKLEQNGAVYCFEKSGAPISDDFTELLNTPVTPRPRGLFPSGITMPRDVNATLLTFHFTTCLLWHVAEGGQKHHERAIYVSQNVHKDVEKHR
jgi:hypothetical protein